MLAGGLWSVTGAVRTEGAPCLTVACTPTNGVTIFWPAPSAGFILQENPRLGTADWTRVGATPVEVGGVKQIIVTPPVGCRFYRLIYQQ